MLPRDLLTAGRRTRARHRRPPHQPWHKLPTASPVGSAFAGSNPAEGSRAGGPGPRLLRGVSAEQSANHVRSDLRSCRPQYVVGASAVQHPRRLLQHGLLLNVTAAHPHLENLVALCAFVSIHWPIAESYAGQLESTSMYDPVASRKPATKDLVGCISRVIPHLTSRSTSIRTRSARGRFTPRPMWKL